VRSLTVDRALRCHRSKTRTCHSRCTGRQPLLMTPFDTRRGRRTCRPSPGQRTGPADTQRASGAREDYSPSARCDRRQSARHLESPIHERTNVQDVKDRSSTGRGARNRVDASEHSTSVRAILYAAVRRTQPAFFNAIMRKKPPKAAGSSCSTTRLVPWRSGPSRRFMSVNNSFMIGFRSRRIIDGR
jgi:hypothetical protein